MDDRLVNKVLLEIEIFHFIYLKLISRRTFEVCLFSPAIPECILLDRPKKSMLCMMLQNHLTNVIYHEGGGGGGGYGLIKRGIYTLYILFWWLMACFIPGEM